MLRNLLRRLAGHRARESRRPKARAPFATWIGVEVVPHIQLGGVSFLSSRARRLIVLRRSGEAQAAVYVSPMRLTEDESGPRGPAGFVGFDPEAGVLLPILDPVAYAPWPGDSGEAGMPSWCDPQAEASGPEERGSLSRRVMPVVAMLPRDQVCRAIYHLDVGPDGEREVEFRSLSGRSLSNVVMYAPWPTGEEKFLRSSA